MSFLPQPQFWRAKTKVDGKTPYYLYDFGFRGRRYQGTTRFVNKAAAKRFEANLIDRLAKTRAGIVELEPPPFFLFFAAQFLETVKNALAAKHCARLSHLARDPRAFS